MLEKGEMLVVRIAHAFANAVERDRAAIGGPVLGLADFDCSLALRSEVTWESYGILKLSSKAGMLALI